MQSNLALQSPTRLSQMQEAPIARAFFYNQHAEEREREYCKILSDNGFEQTIGILDQTLQNNLLTYPSPYS